LPQIWLPPKDGL